MIIKNLFRNYRNRNVAKKESIQLCQLLHPDEMIFGVVVCADEPDRFVVRVFCGQQTEHEFKTVPWKNCFLFAVSKNDNSVVSIRDEKYMPRLL